jgi:primosomal protein N' (replication factor Y)
MEYYAEVILPLPLNKTFTYHIPEPLIDSVKPGFRVIVPFGRKKYYTAIVTNVTNVNNSDFELKDITHVPDTRPIIRHPQLKLWEWAAEYYMCSIGDVYKAAVPSGLKIESETQIESNPDFDGEDLSLLTERECLIYQHLESKGKMTPGELTKETGFRNVEPLIGRLIEKGAVIVSEKLIERYRSKKEHYVRINARRDDIDELHRLFDAVKSAKKQESLLMAMIQMSGFTKRGTKLTEVRRSDLLEKTGVTTAVLQAAAKKGIFELYTKETERFTYQGPASGDFPTLSEPQKRAADEIHTAFNDHAITLLHGVTSSGKTEIYIHLIDFILKMGLQVLYLVPEIALTTQLTERLQRVFGSKVVVYHSRFSDNRRVEIWHKMLKSSEPMVIIGARSTVFLPFAKLGLVIVDEEHEPSYKQYDPAPRYNGRDLATVLAMMHGAKTLLGSATPTIETYYKCLTGKYGLVTLSERYEGVNLPEIQVIDTATERKKSGMRGAFSTLALTSLRGALERKEQVIIFHNRRGYAPLARCRQCSYIPKCENCDVSLTYHRYTNTLMCHYCGAQYKLPESCPSCGEPQIEIVGYGTERIEDDVEKYLSGYKSVRLDLDTTRNKDDYQTIIDSFSNHQADILIGTQMVSKGLDFGDVSTVAILNADTTINFPDFRSTERAFNMLEQVSGRAGRRKTRGRVLVQTAQPGHPVIQHLLSHNYNAFYDYEIGERRRYCYPPFSRVIYIYIKHRDNESAARIAESYGTELRKLFGNRVFGPETPAVSRVQLLYIRKIMLKIEPNVSISAVKSLLNKLHDTLRVHPLMKGLILYYDVDPQ